MEIDLIIPKAPWLTKNFHLEKGKIRYLGKGQSGQVYHMISKVDHLPYAVKIIQLEQDKNPKDYVSEAKLIKDFTHSSIVKIYDFHIWTSNPFNYVFLVSELAKESLNTFLKNNKKKLTELQYFEMVDQLVDGLNFCHQKNIIHFDLKPDNILVFENFKLKICDFGSAKQSFGLGTCPLLTNSLSLTYSFASPEMIEISNNIIKFDKLKTAYNWSKMDVYSLGLTMLNILGVQSEDFYKFKAEQEPGYSKNLEITLKKIVKETKFQNIWVAFLEKMLKLDPKNRCSIDKLKEDLKKMKSTNSAGELVENMLVKQCTMEDRKSVV